ncbi:ADP-ribosylglycohydrolase family protein [Patulibacter minatonensis]|uniref:ADP-ribosylglycohydrolase family protein n=1 Tax=Patulibacter minatonensis TaxID=298163 RepID=UPI000687720D|nr:ADP-ribosylglycohydrolase family protein [Patulibacter minatonensis]
MLIPPEPPRLYVSHDADFHWLVALEFGRVGEDQPQACWVPLSETFAYLLDAPEGRVVGFRVNDFHEFDPEDPEVVAIWDEPRFDVPVLGLMHATAGEIAIAARRRFGDEDSLNRKIFGVATAHQGEEALVHWRHCLESGDAMAHFALGYTLLGLDRAPEAYGHLRHYTEIAPLGAWNWCWYGQAAEAVGELSEARRAYRRAIELAHGDDAGAGADAAARLAELPDVVGEAVAPDAWAPAGAAADGEPAADGDGAFPVDTSHDPMLLTPDGRLVPVDHDEPARPSGVAPRIAFDGTDFPTHGVRAVAELDVHLAAGITAGARPKSYAHTDVNEDAVRVLRSNGATVAIVCDGHRGESSARIAAEVVARILAADPHALHDDDVLLDAFDAVNDEVRAQTAQAGQPESRTTLALAVVEHGRIRWVHMGDSLLAVVEPDGTVRRLGKPRHRFLGWPMDRDGVDAATGRGIEHVAPGGWIVLATDGLPDFATPWRDAVRTATGIEDVEALDLDDVARGELRPSAVEVVGALIDAAGAGGAGDNVSVVVLGRPPLTTTDDGAPSVRDRIRGGMLGGAVGDALGAGIEFDDLERIRRRFGPGGLTDPAPAYGRDTGAITDDTQLALFTAEGLLRAFTRFETKGIVHAPSMVDRSYARWLRTQGDESRRHDLGDDAEPGALWPVRRLHSRRGPGRTTIAALRGRTAGELQAPTNASKGAGAVARTAPIGLLGNPSNAFRLGTECAVLTHGHRTGHLAAGTLALLLALLREGFDLHTAFDRATTELATWEDHEETSDALEAALGLAALAEPTPENIARLGRGWVADEAVAIAVFCAFRARDLEHGLLLAVNHGGASATTGAICGAILGTHLGAGAIPERWLADLELRSTVEEVAADLDAAFGDPPTVDPEEGAWWARWPGC